jgi:hypothetical protein
MGETMFSKDSPQGRLYSWFGDDYASVTSVLKKGIAKPDLVGWAAKSVAKIAVASQEQEDGSLRKLSIEELMSAFDSERNGASNIGNIVHAIAEKISKSQEYEVPNEPSDVARFVDSFNQFITDWSPKFIESEAFVVSKKYQYAGTLDAIVEIDGEIYILDIKTGKGIYPEVALQLSAYARADFIGKPDMLEHPMPGINMNRGLVLHIRPTRYELHPVMIGEEVYDTFLSALDIYNYDTYLKHYLIGPKMTPVIDSVIGDNIVG